MNTKTHTEFLVGFEDYNDFWCYGETQDRKEAERELERFRKEKPEKEWVIIARITNYEKV